METASSACIDRAEIDEQGFHSAVLDRGTGGGHDRWALSLLARRILDATTTEEGLELELSQRGEDFFIFIDRWELMQSRSHESEKEMAHMAKAALGRRKNSRWLVGGLGMGFTLRACLDALDENDGGSVVVAEVFKAVVEWNKGPLGPLADHPLGDPRARVEVADVYDHLRTARESYDVILLDVDNGPEALTLRRNQRIYQTRGLSLLHQKLSRNGVLAVWSATADSRFEALLGKAGFDVETRMVRARAGRGERYWIFLAKRQG